MQIATEPGDHERFIINHSVSIRDVERMRRKEEGEDGCKSDF